jgi:IS6 family transposase
MARSSTSCYLRAVTWRPPGASSPGRCARTIPAEVTTDRAPAYPRVLDELLPSALHTVEQYANNPIEADYGRLKARLRPMCGLKQHRSARTLPAGHAFVQNLRRGHYEIATEVPSRHRLRIAFDDLAITI